ASFEGQGTWYLGAPDILLTRAPDAGRATQRLQHHAEQGRRVLLLATSPSGLAGDQLPQRLDPVALVVLEEKVRDTAAATIDYFEAQDVTVKVISGDNPVTVAAVAQRVGVAGAEHPVDARELPEDPEALAEAVDRHAVFG